MVQIYEYPELRRSGVTFAQMMDRYPDKVFKFPSKNIFSDEKRHRDNTTILNSTLREVYGILVTDRIIIVPERDYNSTEAVFPSPSDLFVNHPVDRKYLHPGLSCLEDQKKFVDVIISWFKEIRYDPFLELLHDSEPLPGIQDSSEVSDRYEERTTIQHIPPTEEPKRINIVIYGPPSERGKNTTDVRVRTLNADLSYGSMGRGTAVNIGIDPYITKAIPPNIAQLGIVGFFHECVHAYHFLVGKKLPDSYMLVPFYIPLSGGKRLYFEEIVTTGGSQADLLRQNEILVEDYYTDMKEKRESLVRSYTQGDANDPIYQFNQKYGKSPYDPEIWNLEIQQAFDGIDEQTITRDILDLPFRGNYINVVYEKFRVCNPPAPPLKGTLGACFKDPNPRDIRRKKVLVKRGLKREWTQAQFLKENPDY